LLEQAQEDVLAFCAFRPDHRRKIRSTNPLEQLNREIERRTDVALRSSRTMSASWGGATCRPVRWSLDEQKVRELQPA
jgi:mutator family transposase